MSALNEIKQCLSQTTEHGKGSTSEVLIEQLLNISQINKKDGEYKNDNIPHNEISLRKSVISFLNRELDALIEAKDDDAVFNHYLETVRWIIRLGRVLTTRDEQNPKKKHFGKRF